MKSKEKSIVLDNTIQDQQQHSSLSKSNPGPNSSTIGSRLQSFLRLLQTIQVVTQQGPLSPENPGPVDSLAETK